MIPVYCINAFPERRPKIAAELARVGFTDISYVAAQEPAQGFTMSNMRRNPRGEFGCVLSHLKAICMALAANHPYALFVEDDIVFADDMVDPFHFPPMWDVVYLGGSPRGPVETDPFCERWQRLRGGFSCTEAYVLHADSMAEFMQFWCDRAGQPNAMFDFVLGDYAASVMGYAVYPPITHQPPGYSHIGQKHDDKRELIRRGWETNLPA